MASDMRTRGAVWVAAAAVAATVAGATTASAAPFEPEDIYVAGSFFNWATPNGQLMTENPDGTYSTTITGLTPGARHEFKLTNGTWDDGGNIPGANSWLYADGTETTITFTPSPAADGWSPSENRIALSDDPGTWTAAGSFQSEVGGTDWTNGDPTTAMTHVGGGVYQYDAVLPAGTYLWKAVVTGSWDSISWDTRSVGTADWEFTVGEGEFARLSVNSLAGTANVEIVPEPASLGLLGLGAVVALRRRARR